MDEIRRWEKSVLRGLFPVEMIVIAAPLLALGFGMVGHLMVKAGTTLD